jgi:hypothetical protein
MKENCMECKWWFPVDKGDHHKQGGTCRRHSPIWATVSRPPEYEEKILSKVWPFTLEDDGCGDYEAGENP